MWAKGCADVAAGFCSDAADNSIGVGTRLISKDRYCNSDYAIASVLEQQKDLPYMCWSYDIECQHSINRVARFERWFPDLVPVVKRITGCIPKMHINNHKDDCMYRYSFNYTPGVGCTCGEGIETTWAEADQTAGSTKKENRGHRHDSLDDFHGYWNWEKVVKMGKFRTSADIVRST